MRLLIEAANARVAITDGRIADPDGHFDRIIRIPDGEIRPGLINAHDHLHRNHYGRLGHGPYDNAYQWAADIQQRDRDAIAQGRRLPRREALLRGAWKNLLAGVTHVMHHDHWESEFNRDFPVHVVPVASADSLGMTPGIKPGRGPFALHVAEGSDAGAAAEVRLLAARGLLNAELLAVHAVGADADGVARLREAGCAVVWCPSSNDFLLGRTAPADLLADGMDVLLGTDSLLTGAGDLLEELRIARAWGLLSDDRLLDAVGLTAARRLGIAPPSLAVGAEANLAVFRKSLLAATAADVALVMVAGRIRVLDPALMAAIPRNGRIITQAGLRRWIDAPALQNVY